MRLSDLSIKRPVLAVVMSLLLVVLGLMSFLRLTLRELPAIDPPIVSVQVDYPGASAGVVETRVTKPLEDALAGIEGINTIDSNSRNGSSRISIEFYASRDIEAAANDVRNAVSRVADRMPDEARAPEITKVEADSDAIIWFNLRSSSMDQMQMSDYAQRYLVDRFSSLQGVARVFLGGSQRYAMRIWLDGNRLAARGLTPADVERALRAENVELGAGRIESTDRDFILRVARDYTTPEAFAQMPLGKGSDGYVVRLGDVARVALESAERRAYYRSNGEPAMGIGIVQPRSSRRSQGRGRSDPPDPAGRHRHLRRLRQHHLHLRLRRARLRNPAGGHCAGTAGDLAVPRQRARGLDPGRHGAGVRDRVLHRVLDQPADLAGAGAVHRAGGG